MHGILKFIVLNILKRNKKKHLKMMKELDDLYNKHKSECASNDEILMCGVLILDEINNLNFKINIIEGAIDNIRKGALH